MEKARNELRNAVKAYLGAYGDYDEEWNERIFAGVLAFIAVERIQLPFTPVVPPVVIEEETEEEVKND